MILYALVCEFEHQFEAWFSSSSGFDEQKNCGQIICPHCGTTEVEKAIMAPSINTRRAVAPQNFEQLKALAEASHTLCQHIETNCDYVGTDLPEIARDMHSGRTQSRPIYGEASREEVKALIEDGVSIMPVPKRISLKNTPHTTHKPVSKLN